MAERDLSKQRNKGRVPRPKPVPGLAEELEANGENVPEGYTRADRAERAGPGRACLTCTDIERAMVEGMIVDGQPWIRISKATGGRLDHAAIKRHAKKCFPALMRDRVNKTQGDDEITVELIKDHLTGILERTKESHDAAIDETNDEGERLEGASGIAAAAGRHIDAVKLAGQYIGVFDQKNKIEILLRDPSTQEVLSKLLDGLCSECTVAAREIMESMV